VLQKQKGGRRTSENVERFIDDHRATLEKYEALCHRLGEQPAHIALAWLLQNPVVTAPIIGPRTQEQLDDSLRALDVELSPETLQELDSIFPPPWGTDPNKPPFGFLI
jgi:aryl-alcohol dehydrogenase-like predicted oxidoreductase